MPITHRPPATCDDCGLGYDVHVEGGDELVADAIDGRCDDCGGDITIDEDLAIQQAFDEMADRRANDAYALGRER